MSNKFKKFREQGSNRTAFANHQLKNNTYQKKIKTVKLGAIHTLQYYLNNLFPEKNTITVELSPLEFHDLCKKRLAQNKNTIAKKLSFKVNPEKKQFQSNKKTNKNHSSENLTVKPQSEKNIQHHLNQKTNITPKAKKHFLNPYINSPKKKSDFSNLSSRQDMNHEKQSTNTKKQTPFNKKNQNGNYKNLPEELSSKQNQTNTSPINNSKQETNSNKSKPKNAFS